MVVYIVHALILCNFVIANFMSDAQMMMIHGKEFPGIGCEPPTLRTVVEPFWMYLLNCDEFFLLA